MVYEWLLGILLLFCAASTSTASSLGCINNTAHDGQYLLCVGRPSGMIIGRNTSFLIKMVAKYPNMTTSNASTVLNVSLDHSHLAEIDVDEFELTESDNVSIGLHALKAGKSDIIFECANYSTCLFSKDYMKLVQRDLAIAHSHPLDIIISIVGWIYFVAWSVSFYPQIFLNFYRRSVVGLNFDFLALNITGFLAYAVFNIGLFWIPLVQRQYFVGHPAGVNPVQLNDVIFSVHAVLATLFTIFQCFIFKRGNQKLSYTAIVLLVMFWLILVISLFVAVGNKMTWLTFLNVASYVKLVITILKYIPQAWFNFRRRSTVGWSIGNVLLDFTGGSFSILQMFLLSYNYDDWHSIFGDVTKFGLGLFSIVFDLLFMFQHYVLFRNRNPPDSERGYKKIEDDTLTPPQLNDGEKSASLSDEERPLLRGKPKGIRKLEKFLKFWKL